MKNPLVTILIPTYNRATLLRESIVSALAQSYDAIEVLILDDASTDSTPAVASGFADDPRVHYIRHLENIGIANNWRSGIEAAKGEFFCILHDDDTFESTFVETLAAPLKQDPSLIFAFSDHWVMNVCGERNVAETDRASVAFKRRDLRAGKLYDWTAAALVDGSVPVGATLFRRSMIEPTFINQQAKGAIDFWLFYQCAQLDSPVHYVNARLMNYRLHTGGMSQRSNSMMEEGHIYRCRQILSDPKMSAIHKPIRRQLASAFSRAGVCLLREGNNGAARSALGQSIKLNRTGRSYIAYALAWSGPIGSSMVRALR